MSECRVTMTAEQARELDRYIHLLMRAGKNERASLMMGLRIQFYDAERVEPELPANVVALDSYSRKVGA